MCIPSATSAIEPNKRPPTISAIIMAPQSQITAHVFRSLLSCSSPRKTCECWCAIALLITPSLLEVGADHFQQLLGGVSVECVRVLADIDQMRANVVLYHLRHQSGHRPPCARDQVHDLFAARFAIECPFDGL